MNNKWEGELAEMKFQVKATECGCVCSKPFGDLQPYDFITHYDKTIKRVQIKSTRYLKNAAYYVDVLKAFRRKYKKEDYDILACYISPKNLWYLIPAKDLQTSSVALYPHSPNNQGKYEKYKENWDLLRGKE